MTHRMLTTLEACDLLRISRSTFLRLQAVWTRHSPVPFPSPMRVTSQQFYWDEDDLVKWRRAHRKWRYSGIFSGAGSDLMTGGQISEALSIPTERLRTHRQRDQFPDPVDQVGRSPLWTRQSIREWILNAEVVSRTDLLPKRTDWQ